MISIEASRSGEPTAKVANRYIHSKYSPLKEAADIYKNSNLDRYSTFVVIEPGFNYISDILNRENPDARIISIHFIHDFYNVPLKQNEKKFYFNGNHEELFKFLKLTLTEFDLDGLKLLEWAPAVNIFRDSSTKVSEIISQAVREIYGNITTVSGFGKRMFTNSIKNFLSHRKRLDLSLQPDAPVVITGSGPGLSKDIGLLSKNRSRYILAALPSSVDFLKYNSISPDLIISTDPGYYASLHLSGNSETAVAAPFSAKLTAEVLEKGILPLSQNSFLDSLLFEGITGYFRLPSNGTVAGSALYLASIISTGPVFLCGLDFSFIDARSHIRPHAFDTLIESSSTRNNTVSSMYFKRNITSSSRLSGNRRTNIQLKTYAGWFASVSSMFSSRVFFLNHFQSPPGNFQSVNSNQFAGLLGGNVSISFSAADAGTSDDRKDFVAAHLSAYKNMMLRTASDISNCNSSDEIFILLNNDLTFNLYLPELLEFKKHIIKAGLHEARDRALGIIRKTNKYLEGFNV